MISSRPVELSVTQPSTARGAPALVGPSRREVDRDLLVIAVLVLALAALLQVTPARDGVMLFGWRLPESCLAKRVTDVGCPGCGLTRSFVLGVRGDPEAFRLHPLGPALLLLLVAQVPYRAARLLRARRVERAGLVDLSEAEAEARPRRAPAALRWTIIGALVLVWTARLLGGGPP